VRTGRAEFPFQPFHELLPWYTACQGHGVRCTRPAAAFLTLICYTCWCFFTSTGGNDLREKVTALSDLLLSSQLYLFPILLVFSEWGGEQLGTVALSPWPAVADYTLTLVMNAGIAKMGHKKWSKYSAINLSMGKLWKKSNGAPHPPVGYCPLFQRAQFAVESSEVLFQPVISGRAKV